MLKTIKKSLLHITVLMMSLSSVLLAVNNLNLTIIETQDAEWDDGFCNTVVVANSSDTDIDWTIDLPIEGEITGMWSASYTQNSETLVAKIEGEDWANLSRANSSADFSYCANKVEIPAVANEEGDLVVTQTKSAEWDGGFCVDVDINNNKDYEIDWEVTITSEGFITGLWDAQYTFNEETLEATVSSNSGWNDTISANGYVNFNYCALEPEDTVVIVDNNNTETEITTYTVNPIKTDQFGYLPTASKIAVISNPIEGFNAGETFEPSSNYEIRKVSDDSMVWNEGTVTQWNNGATHSKSGDKVWHYDFTAFQVEGEYYIYDVDKKESSYPFKISATVYNEVLKQSVRMLYLQRSNFAKVAPYVKEAFIDGKAFPQDEIATAIADKTNTATQKDISGGWFDAGDYNKYVNYADEIVHDLLIAYKTNPTIWRDDYNIPESGNGVADILDEVRYELDWVLKMQVNSNDVDGTNPAFTVADKGSFLHKASALDFGHGNDSPPSSNQDARYYAEPTVSATISAVGLLAHAAIVYESVDSNYALKLKNAAIDGWNYLNGKAYSSYDNSGFQTAGAEDDVAIQKSNKAMAAIYLYGLTSDTIYKNYYENNALDAHIVNQNNLSNKDKAYFNSGGTWLGSHDAQLYYTSLAGANSNFIDAIKENYTFAQTNKWVDFAPIKEYESETNPYLSFLDSYPWGSNMGISSSGNMLMNMLTHDMDSANSDKYAKAATGYLHYLHGLNPQNLVYLSSMNDYGAEKSVDQMHHAWFVEGIETAPGFLVGGAVDSYEGDAKIYGEDVSDQPSLKAYASDYDSYEMSEPQLMYQSAYIRLLGSIMANNGANASVDVKIANGDDDVEEIDADWMYFGSSDLELIRDKDHQQMVGLRFINLEIPEGAQISNAYIQFTSEEVSSDESTILNIYAQGVADAPKFTSETASITNRTRAGASVTWDVPVWDTVHENGEKQRTPDLKSMVQEVVNLNGWASGNAMVFMFNGTGKRTAESYDGSSTYAPTLHVEYSY